MEHHLSPLVEFASEKLHVLLIFMGVVYAFKIRWILLHPAGRDRQAPTGSPDTTGRRGAVYSLFNIAMPWMMPSTRKHKLFYAQFVIFHIGVACSIAMSIVFSYWPVLISSPPVVLVLQIVFAAAFVVGLIRFIRRVGVPIMRMISSPDDIFSVALLTVWLALSYMMAVQAPAFAAAKGQLEASASVAALNETPILIYYFVTSFFLVYVPFSKISHYIYYPFSRWYLGRTLGHRGVYPMKSFGSEAGAKYLS
ncbi:MAG: hypothetical protein ABIH66_13935 [bacterium]